MKICWDNLENLRLSKNGNFKDVTKKNNNRYYYFDSCDVCKEPFLSRRKDVKCCSKSCSRKGKNNPRYGDHRTWEELHGKEKSEHLKNIKSEQSSGENNPNYRDKHWAKTKQEWKDKFLNNFKNELSKKNYELLDCEWKGSNKYYSVKCDQGHVYKTKPSYFYSGRRCPKCYQEKFFSQEQIKNFITERGYEIIEWNYKNNRSLLKLKCKCGNIFRISWGKFLSSNLYSEGFKCNECRIHWNLTSIEDIIEFVKNENYELLSEEYKCSNSKLQFKCPNGHEFWMLWSNFVSGNRCPKCQPNYKKSYEEIWELYNSEGYKLLTPKEDYINTNQYVLVKCNQGHIYESKISYFLVGNRCPKCWWESTSSHAEMEIQNYVKTIVSNVICNDRTIITNPKTNAGLELDIWLPDLNKAIEYNGDYWHSKDLGTKQRDTIKKNQCKKNNIDLLIVKECDYKSDKEMIEQKIRQFIIGE